MEFKDFLMKHDPWAATHTKSVEVYYRLPDLEAAFNAGKAAQQQREEKKGGNGNTQQR